MGEETQAWYIRNCSQLSNMLLCMQGGERCVKALEKRFQLGLTEVRCVQHVLTLISDSLDAWRTRQYDYYQRVLNGIL